MFLQNSNPISPIQIINLAPPKTQRRLNMLNLIYPYFQISKYQCTYITGRK